MTKISEIIPHIEAGKTYAEIGVIYGKKEQTIQKWVNRLRDNGFDIPPRKPGRRRLKL